ATVNYFATRVIESIYIQNLTRDLAEKGKLIASALPSSPDDARLRELAHEAEARLTVINRQGDIQYDSEVEPARVENDSRRAGIIEARAGRGGSAQRDSAVAGVKNLYVAIPIPGGALRLAKPLSEISTQLNSIRLQLLTATAFAFLPAILIAAFF